MAYTPNTFIDRSTEFPNRRLLTPVSGVADTYDITRAEGTIFEVGTMPDATNLNTEFSAIQTETDLINQTLDGLTGTLVAGQTDVTISDSRITTSSTIFPTSSVFGVNPTNIVVTTGQAVLTFPIQTSDLGVKVVVL